MRFRRLPGFAGPCPSTTLDKFFIYFCCIVTVKPAFCQQKIEYFCCFYTIPPNCIGIKSDCKIPVLFCKSPKPTFFSLFFRKTKKNGSALSEKRLFSLFSSAEKTGKDRPFGTSSFFFVVLQQKHPQKNSTRSPRILSAFLF